MDLDLITKIYNDKKKEIKNYPCHVNRSSALGDDCERKLVYMRTHWEQAALHDVGLQWVFDTGNVWEPHILRCIEDAGFTVVEQQVTLSWREYQISGHIDAVVVIDGQSYPLEVKTMSPHIFNSVFKRGPGVYEWDEVEKSFASKPWLRKYPAQLTLYCLMKSLPTGIWICKDKASGAMAQINKDLDYDLGESLLKRAERINEHVSCGTIPDPIPFDPDVCGKCEYNHICCPDKVAEPMLFLEDETVIGWLGEREESEEASKMFKQVDSKVKEWAKAQKADSISVGDFLIQKSTSSNGAVRCKVERILLG